MKFAVVVLGSLLLASCVTTGDMQLSKNVYQVNVQAGGTLFVSGAENAALRKAAELTLANGYTSFIIQTPSIEAGTSYAGTTPGFANTTVNIVGSYAYGQTTYTPGVPIFRPHKDVNIIVVMFHPGDPGSANAIDAKATLKRLNGE